MNIWIQGLSFLTLFFYAVTTGLYTWFFFKNDKAIIAPMQLTFRITLGLQGIYVLVLGLALGHLPMASAFQALTLVVLAVSIIYIYIEYHLEAKTTGFFVVILIFVMQLISTLGVGPTAHVPEVLYNPFFIIHTSTAMLGYSAFAIAALYGLMYLLLFYSLKGGRFGVIYNRMPSLEMLNEMNNKASQFGLFFLTFSIIIGVIWAKFFYDKNNALDPKTVVGMVTWFIFTIQLIGRRVLRWGGKRLAYFAITGFIIVVLSMIAINTKLVSL